MFSQMSEVSAAERWALQLGATAMDGGGGRTRCCITMTGIPAWGPSPQARRAGRVFHRPADREVGGSKASTLVLDCDRDARLVLTIVRRREDEVLQREAKMHHGRDFYEIRDDRPYLTSITRRVHCVGRDQAIGKLSAVPTQEKGRIATPREEFVQWDVETPPISIVNMSSPGVSKLRQVNERSKSRPPIDYQLST